MQLHLSDRFTHYSVDRVCGGPGFQRSDVLCQFREGSDCVEGRNCLQLNLQISMPMLRGLGRQGVAPAAAPGCSRYLHRHPLCHATPSRNEKSEDVKQVTDTVPDAAEQAQSAIVSSSSSSTFPYNVMTALAAAGTLETTYLTVNKLLNTAVACPTSGCDTVLSSSYAELFGVPLPLFGAAAYGAVAAASYLAVQSTSSGRAVPGWISTGLTAGVGVLAATSGYLMYILQTQLGGASCVWCYASAGISLALLSCLIAGMDKRQMADAAAPGLGATAAAFLTLYLGFGPGQGITNAAELDLPYVEPVVTTESSEQTVSLAKRLKAAGAKMYGAFWCSHCYDQKQEFGQQAMADFPYVECFPEGWRKGVKIADACEAASVKAFPTWVINSNVTEGQLELNQLEQLLEEATQPVAATASADAAVQ